MTFKTLPLFIFLSIIGICSISCNKKPDPAQETNILFLGHKGGGNNNYNDVNMENSLPAIKEGVRDLDGIETDLQMSIDGTIWLYHDAILNSNTCEEIPPYSILFMRDSTISKLNLCHNSKKDRLYKLEELIALWDSIPNFYMSLEVKTSWSKEDFEQIGGRDAYLTRFADQLAKVLEKSKAQEKIIVEIDSKLFCDKLREYPSTQKIKTCLISYGDIDIHISRAVKLGYNGISCNYTEKTITAESILKAHTNGLFVQLWTPYYETDLTSVFHLQPDFIQTDNVRAKRLLNVR